MREWQVVFTATLPQDVYLAQSLLESEGIETLLQDELTAQVNNFYSNAIGGVKLLVRQGDFERSLALLEEGGYVVERASVVKLEIVREFDKVHCPFCGSENIGKKKEANPAMVVLFFLFSVLLPIFKPDYLCWDCGKEWRHKR